LKNKNVIISFGKRPLINRVVAAFFYSLILYTLYRYHIDEDLFSNLSSYQKQKSFLYSVAIYFVIAIKLSVVVNHHFNFQEMKYRKFYSVGPIGFGKWHVFKKLDRVSTFLNSSDKCEVNIWDVKNNKYKIAVFDVIEDAIFYGRDLAKNLKIIFKERN
jgi:hypothetical protein